MDTGSMGWAACCTSGARLRSMNSSGMPIGWRCAESRRLHLARLRVRVRVGARVRARVRAHSSATTNVLVRDRARVRVGLGHERARVLLEEAHQVHLDGARVDGAAVGRHELRLHVAHEHVVVEADVLLDLVRVRVRVRVRVKVRVRVDLRLGLGLG
eukprot:scaffold45579_cov67-Phaeocystis_antarctica.AAC.10